MKKKALAFAAFAAALMPAMPAFAHHVMDGKLPVTFPQGLLSGLGHPIIGLDHFAAVLAVGGVAALHRKGAALAIGFVVAMMIGVAVHVRGASVPGAEILVALTVIVLGVALVRRRQMPSGAVLALFSLAGLIHGYALGESIFGAEPAPLAAYLIGLAAIQGAIALGAMSLARTFAGRLEPVTLRLAGAGIAGVGIAILVQQLAAAA